MVYLKFSKKQTATHSVPGYMFDVYLLEFADGRTQWKIKACETSSLGLALSGEADRWMWTGVCDRDIVEARVNRILQWILDTLPKRNDVCGRNQGDR